MIRYDLRGTGLSEPAADPDFSIRAQVEDLGAVVDRLRLDPLALFAAQHAGPAALAFAAANPERVSHLILWCTYASGVDYFASKQSRALHGMQGQDWELFTRAITHAHLGWPEGTVASELAAAMRDTLAPAVIAAFDAAASTVDVTNVLGEVRARTLVLHPRKVTHPDPGNSRRLAAAIPDAHMVLLDGASIAPFVGDTQPTLRVIDDFLGHTVRSAQRVVGEQREPLSEREREVLALVAAGLSNREIADQLIISPGTAKTHTASIYRKLDVSSRTRAVARARELGLLND